VADALEVVPPDVLRYMVLRNKPMKAITYDPGLPLLTLIDEFDDAEAKNRDARAITLSRATGWKASSVPFKHIVAVLQIANFDVSRGLEILNEGGYKGLDAEAVSSRFEYAKKWLARYAPEEIKFSVAKQLPAESATLDPAQRGFLGRLSERLEPGMTGEQIHALVYELAKEFEGTAPAKLFEAIYVALAGKRRGPRAGSFIGFIGADFARARFAEAAGAA
jgi:lysyl-tRNA synthetase class 1